MSDNIAEVEQLSADKRLNFLMKQLKTQEALWILTDEHGAVMLNSEDEDCIPVWPGSEFAERWATGEWDKCKPMSINLNTWQEKWLPGLEDDDIAIAVFPGQQEDGIVLFPYEFAQEMQSR